MTKVNRELLESAASSDGQDTSTWARNVLLRSAKRKASTITTVWTRNVSDLTKGEVTGR